MYRRDLRSALMVRLRDRSRGDRGSLPLLLLVMIATAAFGGIMVTMMLSASKTSENVQARVQALDAAQSGISAVVGQLRAADSSSSTTAGDSSRLPCGSFVSGSGTSSANSGVNPAGNDVGTATYTVSIAYYDVDPSTLGASDLSNFTSAGGQKMLCTSSGPYNTSTSVRTPRYALLVSTGQYVNGTQSSTRVLQTTYNFQVLNQNISGGLIRLYPASSSQTTQWCMDAGSTPGVGTAVTIRACSGSNPPAAQQLWAYRTDLSIELVESVTNPTAAGLCLDTGTSPTSHSAGNPIVLERCAVADASVCPAGYTPTTYHAANPSSTCAVSSWNQQWSVDNSAALEGALTNQSDVDGYCINAASQTSGVALTLQTCTGGVTNSAQTWIPSATAGAGMASAGNNQLVNFQQFATCLDDTGGNLGAAYMILYTCKQNPNPAKVLYNQKFIPQPSLGTAPTQVLLTVVYGSTTYCLKSPQTVGGYPVLVVQGAAAGQCPASVTAAGSSSPFVWTMSQKYANSTGTVELTYAVKYTITDSSSTPLCLGIGAANSGTPNYNTAVVTTCSGDNSQKWNAAAYTSGANLTNTTETNPTTSG